MSTVLFISITLIIFIADTVNAGNFGIGVHSGFGVIKYREESSALGSKFKADSSLDVVISGISGQYSFQNLKNFYANITTDWIYGLNGPERWKDGSKHIQTTDMEVFGQFYDFRLGYKNNLTGITRSENNIYYSLYLSGGWDSLLFKRNKFIWRGTSIAERNTERIGFWRTGMGAGTGYKMGKWALDGRLAYAYYPDIRIDNSSLPQFTFYTWGNVWDIGFGITREITNSINFYFGGSYSLFEIRESRLLQKDSVQAVYPGSRIELIAGMLNLTFVF